MNKVDALFAAKAVSKEIGARVRALEDECKAELEAEFLAGGADRKRSVAFGDRAGYLTVDKAEPEPAREVERFQLVDEQEAVDWMDDQRPDTDGFAADNLEAFCRWWFESTGECPDGCQVLRYRTEPVPAGVRGVRLRVDEKVVLPLLAADAALSGEVNRLLLGDGS